MYYKISIMRPCGTVTTQDIHGYVEHVTSDHVKFSFDTPISINPGDILSIEYMHQGSPNYEPRAINQNRAACGSCPPSSI